MPCVASAAACRHGVLRLRERFAKRSVHSAQDDRLGLTMKTEHSYFAYIVCSRWYALHRDDSIDLRVLEHNVVKSKGSPVSITVTAWCIRRF